jgi:hypothetical protein
MDNIMPITFQKMKNGVHHSFMHVVSDYFTDNEMLLQDFNEYIDTFNLALKAENAAYTMRRKSYITDEMVKLNAKREELYAGMLYHYESALRHYDNSKREAAATISRVMKSVAYIHNSSNIDRTIRLNIIISTIRNDKHAESAKILEMNGWLEALENVNNNYETASMNRDAEKSKRGNGNVRQAREITDKAYKKIVTRINAQIVINGPEAYTLLVNLLNNRIAEEKRSIAIRNGWRKRTSANKTITES